MKAKSCTSDHGRRPRRSRRADGHGVAARRSPCARRPGVRDRACRRGTAADRPATSAAAIASCTAVVEGVGEAQVRPDAHVAAGRRDPQRGLQVRPIDHLPGVGALHPEVVGRLALGDQACARRARSGRANRRARAAALSASACGGCRACRSHAIVRRPFVCRLARRAHSLSQAPPPFRAPGDGSRSRATAAAIRPPAPSPPPRRRRPGRWRRPVRACGCRSPPPPAGPRPRAPARPPGRRRGVGRLDPGHAGHRDIIDEAGGAADHHRQARVVGGGRGQPDQRRPRRVQGVGQGLGLLRRTVDDDQRRRRRPRPRRGRRSRSPG